MKSGNPVLRDDTFTSARPGAGAMTLDGVVNKTGILLLLCMAAFCVTWYQPVPVYIFGGAIAGLVIGITTCFLPRIAPWTSPIYAICEGLFLGGISAFLERKFPFIAAQA